MKFTIDRSKWCRGEPGAALLRSPDGKRCCLGFFLRACGIPDVELLGVGTPSSVATHGRYQPSDWPKEAGFLVEQSGLNKWWWFAREAQNRLVCANDARALSEPAREETIARLFAAHGVEVAFVDGASPCAREEGSTTR